MEPATAPLSVLMVTDPASSPGGVEVHVARLAAALRELGHRVEILPATEHRGVAALLDLWDPNVRHRLESVADRHDLIHIHNFLRELSPSVLGATATPTVVTVHDHRLIRPERVAGRPRVLLGPQSFAQRATARLARRKVRTQVDAVIAVSEELATALASRRITSTVIPPFAPLDTEPWTPPSGDTVTFVGRVAPSKGVLWLLEAARRAARRHPLRLMVVGDGPSLSDLSSGVDPSLDPSLELDLRGRVDPTSVPGLLRSSRMVCVPSIEPEGTPQVVLEAMLVGRPVVASALASTRALLEEGRGVVVEPGDTTALTEAITGLLADDERAAAMGRSARAWAEHHVASSRVVPEIEAVYRRAVGR